jgi:hypothetical protein
MCVYVRGIIWGPLLKKILTQVETCGRGSLFSPAFLPWRGVPFLFYAVVQGKLYYIRGKLCQNIPPSLYGGKQRKPLIN